MKVDVKVKSSSEPLDESDGSTSCFLVVWITALWSCASTERNFPKIPSLNKSSKMI